MLGETPPLRYPDMDLPSYDLGVQTLGKFLFARLLGETPPLRYPDMDLPSYDPGVQPSR